MKKSFKIAAAAAAGAVSLTAAAAQLFPRVFAKIAADRNEPQLFQKARERSTRKLCSSEGFANALAAGQKLVDKGLQRVEIKATDDTTLVGHWYPCEQPKRILLAMHGWRSSWTIDFGASTDFWHDNGCSILYAEQRGQGNSGGDYLTFGMLERYDVLSWAQYLTELTGGALPIYLSGLSMGATSVLLAAELSLPDTVRGIIADCGFSSPDAIWKHLVEQNMHVPYALVRSYMHSFCKKQFGCDPAEISTVNALKKAKVPVLLIHGTADAFVPSEMSEQAKAACASECRLLLVPGAQHAESYLKQTEAYQTLVTDFWRDFDAPMEN